MLLDDVKKLVVEASAFFYPENFDIECKGGNSNFVTTCDINVENYLKQKLPTLLPGSKYIGEESSDNDYAGNLLWIVDPIDGTANFIRGMHLSVISVGLVQNNEPILGVVYNPDTKELFYAEKGKGAFCNGNPITVSNRDFAHGQLCTGFALYKKEFALPCFRIMERVYMEADDMRRLGSAAFELCMVASGRSDLYFEIRLCPWDHSGSLAILKEAGGFYGSPLYDDGHIDYTRPIPLVCANTKENYDHLMEIVRDELGSISLDQM